MMREKECLRKVNQRASTLKKSTQTQSKWKGEKSHKSRLKKFIQFFGKKKTKNVVITLENLK
jgi:hypothetical protein